MINKNHGENCKSLFESNQLDVLKLVLFSIFMFQKTKKKENKNEIMLMAFFPQSVRPTITEEKRITIEKQALP